MTRGATLLHGLTRALSEIPTYLRQLTYALTSRNTEPKLAVPHALGGPFGSLQFGPALSLPDSLCAHGCFDLHFNGLQIFLNCTRPSRNCQADKITNLARVFS